VTEPSRADQIAALLRKCCQSVDAARELMGKGYYEFAVSRAYYAMFYATEALLMSKDLRFAKHKGVIAAFGEHYVKTGLFTQEHATMLTDAFEDRAEGDYDFMASFSREEAQSALEKAARFCTDIERYLHAQ